MGIRQTEVLYKAGGGSGKGDQPASVRSAKDRTPVPRPSSKVRLVPQISAIGDHLDCVEQEKPGADYIDGLNDRILELKGKIDNPKNLTLLEEGTLKDELCEILTQIARQCPGHYVSTVMRLLMKYWTRKEDGEVVYNRKMQAHVDAITTLFRAWLADNHLLFPGKGNIRLLDATGGTGTVISEFLKLMPRELRTRVHLTFNDVSQAAKDLAKEHLAPFLQGQSRIRGIDYTCHDITRELPRGWSDMVVTSQSLIFMCHEPTLRSAMLGETIQTDGRYHLLTKQNTLETLVDTLANRETRTGPSKSELLVIDESPMLLTVTRPRDFDGVVEHILFEAVSTRIEADKFIEVMSKNVPTAQFLGDLRTPIDPVHFMYLMAYARRRTTDSDQVEPVDEAVMRETIREEAVALIRRLRQMHPALIERLQTFDDIPYRALESGGAQLIIDREVYDDNIFGNFRYWGANGRYNLVIINGLAHYIKRDDYDTMLRRVTERKAPPGSTLLLIDRWPAPPGSEMDNTAFRALFLQHPNLEPLATLREGSTFGYLLAVKERR